MQRVTIKERLQQVVAEMTEEEAAAALALVTGARAGATPVDVYGTAWGRVLENLDPSALSVTGQSTIEIPDGIPRVE
jgi:hypothetical protein